MKFLIFGFFLFFSDPSFAQGLKCDKQAKEEAIRLHSQFRESVHFEELKYLGLANVGMFADRLFGKDKLKVYTISNTEEGGAGLWLIVANASKKCEIVHSKLLLEDDG